MNQVHVGRSTVTSVVEQDIDTMLSATLPQATRGALSEMPWLRPNHLAADGLLRGVIQSFVVHHAGKLVVVDTCVGDDKDVVAAPQLSHARSRFLDRFRSAGFEFAAVDFVVNTHLHVDHVGWNTELDDGAWRPTFPNARYLFVAAELAHWSEQDDESARDVYRQSIRPILDAGLAHLIDAPYVVLPGLVLTPAPGHTPSHVMVELTSDGERVLISGDTFHHPCQIAHPEWDDLADIDLSVGVAARRRILAEIADTSTRLLGTHFAHPWCGSVVTHGGLYRFRTDPDHINSQEQQ